MRKAEQRLWDTMRRRAPRELWLQRIENLVGEGVPDVYAAGPWIELKAPHRPVRASTPLLGKKEGLRPAQIAWHAKASSVGVRSFILIRDDSGRLYLLPGALAEDVNGWTAAECDRESVANHWEGVWDVLWGAQQ
jgi:hypothetical protein